MMGNDIFEKQFYTSSESEIIYLEAYESYICVDNGGYEDSLIVGKEYFTMVKLHNKAHNTMGIILNKGVFDIGRFKTKLEVRKWKIENLKKVIK